MLSSEPNGRSFHFGDWYVGITNDLETRLYEEPEAGHNVPREHLGVAKHECPSRDVADQAEGAMLRCGCDGHGGLGQEDSRFVYAYKKIPGVTKP